MSKALKAAIEANDADAVRQALKSVKDLNRKLPGARAPLPYACEVGADQVLEVLIEAGAIAEKKNTFPDDTPFAIAAKGNHAKVLARLWQLKQTSDSTVTSTLENCAIEGRAKALEDILTVVKPRINIRLFRLACVPKNARAILELLIKHGGDVNAASEDSADKGATLLHGEAASGKAPIIKTLVELGAKVNARDDLGRTPLMMLAEQLEWIERTESEKRCIEALKTLLDLGADASLKDNFGNSAIVHCELEYERTYGAKPNPKFIKLLREAGAADSGVTGELFDALRKSDMAKLRKAIAAGADVNHVMGDSPALAWARTEEAVVLLLKAGANPNKSGDGDTPLMGAASSGELGIVKKLIAGGADIHAVRVNGEFINNAYQAAEMNRKFEVVDYLKSLGAGLPKRADAKPLQPGVGSWNDFSELLVKTTVEKAAAAIAKLIKGKAQLNVYGQSLLPGQQAYVVVRPKGMAWCNIFRIAPPRQRFEDAKKTEAFAVTLAKASGVSVLSIEYSDTSDAASVLRVEPDGKKSRDNGWDRESLEEMVGALGDEAPAWAKKQLAEIGEDAPDSSERVVMLAEQEKFVVAAFGFYCEPGRKIDLEVTGYGAESFDAVAFVSV